MLNSANIDETVRKAFIGGYRRKTELRGFYSIRGFQFTCFLPAADPMIDYLDNFQLHPDAPGYAICNANTLLLNPGRIGSEFIVPLKLVLSEEEVAIERVAANYFGPPGYNPDRSYVGHSLIHPSDPGMMRFNAEADRIELPRLWREKVYLLLMQEAFAKVISDESVIDRIILGHRIASGDITESELHQIRLGLPENTPKRYQLKPSIVRRNLALVD